MSILNYFPQEIGGKASSPTMLQKAVIEEVEKAIEAGYKTILIESPVGSGKSAMAITFAKFLGKSHIITPKKSLQDQYFRDFSKYVSTMKGKNSYPCTFNHDDSVHREVIKRIDLGYISATRGSLRCSSGPCLKSEDDKTMCVEGMKRICPYQRAFEVAEASDVIIHNSHSFLYQMLYSNKFGKRDSVIIDEAHTLEDLLRSFTTQSILLHGELTPREVKSLYSAFSYFDVPAVKDILLDRRFFPDKEGISAISRDGYCEVYGPERFFIKEFVGDTTDRTANKQYLDKCTYFNEAELKSKRYVLKAEVVGTAKNTSITLTPTYLGDAAKTFFLEHGNVSILMSGTIYSKNTFCKNLGVNPEGVYFIKVPSPFRKVDRPIYLKDKYLVGTSHAEWSGNLSKIADKIKEIANIFPEAKGLIHTPSYNATSELLTLLPERFIGHSADTFQEVLHSFIEGSDNRVLLSPTCYEGVDLKGDRARFQIILRIPYLNTGDAFNSSKLSSDFNWYKYKALVTFGQQTGRVNRYFKDYGATILMDDRFPDFIERNKSLLPSWFLESIIEE